MRFLLFEKSKFLGGIAKTVNFNGNRINICGHRFFFNVGKSPQFLKSYKILYDTLYGDDSLRVFIVDEKR